jgi:uncharacterized NAD-dependent epimerase/dehydratase family protein
MVLRKPYLLFLGDARDDLAIKTARGLADWRRDWCQGQYRLPGCRPSAGLPDLDIEEAAAVGAQTLVLGVANSGGVMPEAWVPAILRALAAGMDVATGLHQRLDQHAEIAAAAARHGRQLHNVRHTDRRFATATGLKRSGLRLLTVGTDCSVGKMYTALALERELRRRGLKADFRATGQTGILIAEQGVAVDAVVADFIAGAAEWLTPPADPDHWDLVEGQGSLFHPAFAGVTLGLLHGSQPDALVLCHEPTRGHMRGLPHVPMPGLRDCLDAHVAQARLTNAAARAVGVSVNTRALPRAEAARLLGSVEDALSLPCTDPVALGVGSLVDELICQSPRP